MKTQETTTTTKTRTGSKKSQPAKAKPSTKATKPAAKTPAANPVKATKPKTAKDAPRSGSKTAIVLELLQRKEGATLAEIAKATAFGAILLDDFHRCLENPAGFSHSYHKPGGD